MDYNGLAASRLRFLAFVMKRISRKHGPRVGDWNMKMRIPPAVSSNIRNRGLRFFCAAFMSFLIATIGLELDQQDIALVDTLDQYVGDWRIALGSPQAEDQRPDIAIVLVTEDTLLDYQSRSPIDRNLLAELVRAVDAARPRAIALDFIFDRANTSDSALIAAVRGATSPIILGTIDERALRPGLS